MSSVSHDITQYQKEPINHVDDNIINTAIEANGVENKIKLFTE
jgi:hypothetical protein